MIYKYCIVEDNPAAVKSLQLFLNKKDSYEFYGLAKKYTDALKLIEEQNPDLIFLDVELIESSGIDLLDSINQKLSHKPLIIMITAHQEYAVDAINKDVLYFLTKPIDPEDFEEALRKFEEKFKNTQTHLIVKNTEDYLRIPYKELIAIMSDKNYVNLYKSNGETILVSKSLKDIEQMLPEKYIRIHKSFIVKKNVIAKYSLSHRYLIMSCPCILNRLKSDILERESQKKAIKKNTAIDRNHQPETENEVILPIGRSYINHLKTQL